MKILIIGDTHFHNWSIPQLNWYQEDFLTKILPDVVKTNKPDVIVFLGDMFESKSHVDKKVLGLVFSSFDTISKMVSRTYIVVGNHDYYSFTEGPAIDFLSAFKNVVIVKEPTVINNSVPIGFLPWKPTFSKQEINDIVSRAEIIFSHLDLKEVPYNPNIKSIFPKNGLELSMFEGKRVFNGHYHSPQEYDNVIIVGSITQMEVSEIGQKKRLIFYNTATKEVKQINLPHPSFVLVEDPNEYNRKVEENDPHIIPYLDIVRKNVVYERVEVDGVEAVIYNKEEEQNVLTLAIESLKNLYSQLDEEKKKLVRYEELEEMIITSYAERREL